jgi:glyoxylase-like metal-dependent hydrolase (beta-lactamase superfamily II)
MNTDGSNVFYSFTIGDFECHAISDGSYNYALHDFFANVSLEEFGAAVGVKQIEGGTVVSPYTCLHISDGKHSIMVDAGAGNKVGPTAGKLLENMTGAGLTAADVDAVIITHAHPDHIGGLLDASGRPAFPKAHYYLWKAELDFWSSDAVYKHAQISWVQLARRQFFVLQQRIIAIEQESEIVPGINCLAAFGHTPGHMALAIGRGEERLYHVSDVALSPLHLAHPEWYPKYDVDPAMAIETKRRIFDQAAADGALVFAHHFPPFPALGRVAKRQDADGWTWTPIATGG